MKPDFSLIPFANINNILLFTNFFGRKMQKNGLFYHKKR